ETSPFGSMCVGTRLCASNLSDANNERCLDSARHDRLHLVAMETFDVAIVGGGPAGSSCAAFCALGGVRVLVLEREKFPREKVCGDCLNPACWGVLQRLGIAESARQLPHGILNTVEFIAISGHNVLT